MQLQTPLLALSSALRSRLDGSICSEGLIDVQDIHHIARIGDAVEQYRPRSTSLVVDGPSCLWPPWCVRLTRAIGGLSIRGTATGGEQSASTIVYDDDLALADISDLPVLMSVVVRTGRSPEFKSVWWIFCQKKKKKKAIVDTKIGNYNMLMDVPGAGLTLKRSARRLLLALVKV